MWSIDPELIQFELTESVLMADPVSALETLTRLKQLDVKLFVDDYGTGYSSLSYLQKLPVDAIKIDQSFVAPMASSRDSATIVSSTIELGHNLGKQVVAEGVETQDVWDRLNALGCDFAQGYLISKPMPADQLRQWHRSWS
jgi:EAL domain-containing protein (putative c-di-GMP-specific phosphodiesterase class I)